ncbi:hypothetical protein K2173_020868 [Erythroxylum novogranatense]|uniref:Uncharacterized protein n=1 Tax=Erythroxylum novogranatense TaxID=1862640 RepID=A0AAV8TQ17_9ROSI|nr:hypothetical protein K2173_020868 [Erythroxylum novogranatense]
MKVVIKETSVVRPFEDTPKRRLWLSSIDVMYTRRAHTPFLFFYKFNGSGNFFDPEVVKESLSKVLVLYYPVAGRLRRDENGRIEIDCNGDGVLYAEAVADCAMPETGDLTPDDGGLLQVLPPVIYDSSYDLSSVPLLVVQVTRFSCGSVCLGIGWHHNLADGTGFIHFLTSWSSLAQGHPINRPILLDRTSLRSRVCSYTPTFHHPEYDKFPVMNSISTLQVRSLTSQTNSEVIFEISRDQIKALMPVRDQKEESGKTKYTYFEILTAFIWRTACRARNLSHDQATKLRFAVDGRSRLNPPLPPDYFGNAVFSCATMAVSGELLSEPFVETVDRIHKAIIRMDDEYLRSAVEFLENKGDLTSIMHDPGVCACPNLNIVSWTKLPFHAVDFGWGRADMKPTKMFDGKGLIMINPKDEESLMLDICLEANHMQAFQKLFGASFQGNPLAKL